MLNVFPRRGSPPKNADCHNRPISTRRPRASRPNGTGPQKSNRSRSTSSEMTGFPRYGSSSATHTDSRIPLPPLDARTRDMSNWISSTPSSAANVSRRLMASAAVFPPPRGMSRVASQPLPSRKIGAVRISARSALSRPAARNASLRWSGARPTRMSRSTARPGPPGSRLRRPATAAAPTAVTPDSAGTQSPIIAAAIASATPAVASVAPVRYQRILRWSRTTNTSRPSFPDAASRSSSARSSARTHCHQTRPPRQTPRNTASGERRRPRTVARVATRPP